MDRPNQQSNIAYLRLRQIIGDTKADPPIKPIVPVAASTWWLWVKQKHAPAGIRLSRGATVWREADVLAFVERLASEEDA